MTGPRSRGKHGRLVGCEPQEHFQPGVKAKRFIAASLLLYLIAAPGMGDSAPPPATTSHALQGMSELDTRHLTVDSETLPGAAVFRAHCAQCHEGQVPKAPQKVFLQMMSGPTIHEALVRGLMRSQAQSLTGRERVSVAEYLSGESLSAGASQRTAQDVWRR